METLLKMLTYCRPAYSVTEEEFIHEYLIPLGVTSDTCGNLILEQGKSRIMWSCHTDTVHKTDGRQEVQINEHGIVSLASGSKSNCLGADDTAGVWIMREMILAGIPGLYVFHACEERGGVGSSHIASENVGLLKGIDIAVAFDRRGTKSVITHQAGERCCSDKFGEALAGSLGKRFKLDNRGFFTDTANYTHLIPECTNVSVGYASEHFAAENLNVKHLARLRDALLHFNPDDLPVVRDPAEIEYGYDYGYGAYDYYGSNSIKTPFDMRQEPTGSMSRLVKRNPELVADILRAYGVTEDDLASELYYRGGIVFNA